jgi:hypothetical protein
MKKITKTELQKIIKEELDEGFFSKLFGNRASLEVAEKLIKDLEAYSKKNQKPGHPNALMNAFVVMGEFAVERTPQIKKHLKIDRASLYAAARGFYNEKEKPIKKMKPEKAEEIFELHKEFVDNYNEAYKKFIEVRDEKFSLFQYEDDPDEFVERLEAHRAANTPEAAERRTKQMHARFKKTQQDAEQAARRRSADNLAAWQKKQADRASRGVTVDRYDSRGRSTGSTRTSPRTLPEGTKLTKTKLKQIIQEELAKILKEN